MYAPDIAAEHPERPCFVMASSGAVVTYREYEDRANRLAHLLADHGLGPLDHYSIFMENNDRYLESCGAGARSGMYYTCVNSHLTADELAYIVDNSESRALITSARLLDVALVALAQCPRVELCLVVDALTDLPDRIPSAAAATVLDFETTVTNYPAEPLDEERLGAAMLYSSGTTGLPKGIFRPLRDCHASKNMPLFEFLADLWQYRDQMVYLSPAPLYHSAPQTAVMMAIRRGGTVIIMERFDPEHYLQLVDTRRVTHSQVVPTMFTRMLKLDPAVRARYDMSSLECVPHTAAPCPIPIKEQMIDWWGPIILEYYGATEAIGFSACTSQEWLDHKGTVGRMITGEVHVLNDHGNPCPTGTPGTLWFASKNRLEYFNDADKTAEATSTDGTLATTGDVGYVDADGYLYLTDRKQFMIISDGVNIYPQETENLLIAHPKVADAAVIGVPNTDLGEEVKAVIQPMPGIPHDDDLRHELTTYCLDHLAKYKCPRSIDFDHELPRLPTGKLYKRLVRDRYWSADARSI